MQKTKKASKIKAKQFIIEQVFLYQIKEPQHDLLEMEIDKYMVQNRQEEEVEINLLF